MKIAGFKSLLKSNFELVTFIFLASHLGATGT